MLFQPLEVYGPQLLGRGRSGNCFPPPRCLRPTVFRSRNARVWILNFKGLWPTVFRAKKAMAWIFESQGLWPTVFGPLPRFARATACSASGWLMLENRTVGILS